jgi:hypothetical protein
VFLEFAGGHWLSLYACLWPEHDLPPMTERTMTADLADPSTLPDDVPNQRRQSNAAQELAMPGHGLQDNRALRDAWRL